MTSRKKGSGAWREQRARDPYLREARRMGYRSRASFKLEQMQERYRIFAPGMFVLELGAAPGGWSQLLVNWVGERGRVLAIDRAAMRPLPSVEFIQGDVTDPCVSEALDIRLSGRAVDCVVSDLSPNLSGIAAVDQSRMAELAAFALGVAHNWLRPGGNLLIKVFDGEDLPELNRMLKRNFEKLVACKPEASQKRSKERYLLARGARFADQAQPRQ